MRIQGDDEFGRFFRALPIFIGSGLLAYFLLGPSPRPAPANADVFGCYSASGSPPILLDGVGMHVRQVGFPVIPFHLEWSKTGIVLAADAPIRADRTDEGYRFGMDKRGIGLFMHFYRVENGRSYGMFDEKLLAGFQMLAGDGNYLNYDPTDASRCA